MELYTGRQWTLFFQNLYETHNLMPRIKNFIKLYWSTAKSTAGYKDLWAPLAQLQQKQPGTTVAQMWAKRVQFIQNCNHGESTLTDRVITHMRSLANYFYTQFIRDPSWRLKLQEQVLVELAPPVKVSSPATAKKQTAVTVSSKSNGVKMPVPPKKRLSPEQKKPSSNAAALRFNDDEEEEQPLIRRRQ